MAQTAQTIQSAALQQLGSLREEYRVRLSGNIGYNAIMWSLATVLFALAGLLALGDVFESDTSSFDFIVAAIFVLPSLYYLLQPVIYRSWRVLIYSEGVAFVHGSNLEALRWDQIESIRQRIVRRNYRFLIVIKIELSFFTYIIRGLDGTEIRLKNRISNMDGLIMSVSQQYQSIVRPRMVAAYRAGETLAFGRLNLNQQGLSNGQELLAWGEVRDVQVNERTGLLTIKKTGKTLSWFSARTLDIPNLAGFLDLARSIQQNRI